MGEALSFWGWNCTQGHHITLCTMSPQSITLPPWQILTNFHNSTYLGGGHCTQGHLITLYTVQPPRQIRLFFNHFPLNLVNLVINLMLYPPYRGPYIPWSRMLLFERQLELVHVGGTKSWLNRLGGALYTRCCYLGGGLYIITKNLDRSWT